MDYISGNDRMNSLRNDRQWRNEPFTGYMPLSIFPKYINIKTRSAKEL
jgi:hypothetical protein